MKKFLFSVMALFVAVTMSFAQTVTPYTEGFEDYASGLPTGWEKVGSGTVAVQTSQVHSGTKSLKFSSATENVVALPAFDAEISTLQVTLYSKPEGNYPSCGSFDVGYVTDVTDASTFVAVSTWSYTESPSAYLEKNVMLNSAPAGARLAFRHRPSSGSYYWFVDDVVVEALPTCYRPDQLATSEILSTGATINWVAGNGETQFQYVVMPKGTDANWTNATTVNATTATITGLESNTPYDFYVRAICSESEMSAANKLSFRTNCGVQAIPYTNDFESETSNAVPSCWARPDGQSYPYVSGSSSSAYEGSNSLYFYGGGSTTEQFIVLPQIANAINTLAIKFYYKATVTGYSTYGVPQIGYVTDRDDMTTFVALATLEQQSSYTLYEMNLDAAPAEAAYIALRYGDGTSNYGSFYVDNLTVKAIPTCRKPVSLVATPATTSSATITWAAGNNETTFEYVTALAGQAADWTTPVTVNALTATITGLEQDSDYVFYIRANCGNEEISEVNSIDFHAQRYCTPAPTSVDGSGITAVALGGVNQTEAVHKTTAPFYADNTALTFEVPASTTATVDITYATGYTYGTVIWVDWNNDMTFAADELVYAGQSTSSNPTTLSCTFAVPATQAEGTYRMRIGGADSYFDTYISSGTYKAEYPCNTGTYCTYEDYSITVTAAPACTQPATFTYENVTAYGATLNWTAGLTETQFQYVAMPKDTAVDWTNATLVTGLTATISTLSPEKSYDVYLRAYCGETEQSDASMLTFTTIASCVQPTMPVVSDETASSATFTWKAGNGETQFQYVVMPRDTVADWTAAQLVDDTTVTVTGLTANTAYDFYVRAYCAEDDQSAVRKAQFRTACGVYDLPFEENFNKLTSGIPYCWDNTEGNSSASYRWNYYATGFDGACVRFNSYSNGNGNISVLATPAIHLTADARLTFMWKNATGGAGMVLISADGAENRDTLLTELAGITAWTEKTIDLTAYTGQTVNIYFHATSNYGSGDAYLYLDNVKVAEIPACFKPTNVAASAITVNSATLTCTPGGTETQWFVRYQAADAEDWTMLENAVDTPYVLTGLAANTVYGVQMAAVCGTEPGEWSNTTTFRTKCDAEAIPYTENFENGIYCWTVGNMQSESSSYIPSAYSGATYAHDGTYSLRLNAYKTSSTNADSAYAIMPAMNYGVKGLSGHTLKFYARQSSTSTYYSYYNQLMIGVVSNPADMSTFTLVRAEEVTGTNYTFHEVQLGSYAGEGQYIVLLAVTDPTATGTRYGSFYVDDLSVEPTPACQPLASITAVPARTKVEVTLNPKSGLELSAAYDLVCSATELDNEALEAAQKTVVTESPYTVTGLERATPYYIYVRANCGQEDGVSPWVSTTVTTKNVGPDCSASVPQILRTGDGTTKIDYVLWGSYYNRTYSQQIYTAEELTAAGLTPGYISKVAYQYAHTSAYTKTVTLYMGLTELSAFANTSFLTLPVVSEATPIEFATQGEWYEIELSVPLYWDGTSNVVVGAMSRGTNYSPNNTTQFYGGTTTENRAIYSRADNNDPSMETGTLTTNRADVRFTICPIGSPCPAVTEMTVALEGDGTTAARINWTTADADYLSSYDVLLSTTEVTDFTEVTPTATITDPTATTYVFSNLTAETHYYMYLRANCQAAGHDEGMSDWVGVDTIMNSACAAPNTLTTEFIGLNAVKASWHLAYAEQDMAFRYILSTDELDAAGIAAATPVNVDSNVIEIENLNYDQLYYLYVASACGNSTSEYISTSFTTYAACAPVENLTAARVEHNRVQLTWTKNAFGTETSYEVGLVGVEDSEITVTDNTAMLIGLTPETQYTAYVKAICSETSESAIETVEFTTAGQPGNCLLVGTATTSGNMPVTNYNYAYTQMIYTADNFDVTGNIQSIQLKRSTYANVMNNMKVYIGTTDKNVFASNSDWVPEEALTLVYQGSFPAGTADAPDLDIPFSTPFAYDGSSNIVIAISNGHGDWHNIQNFYYTTTTATVLTNRSDDTDTYALHPGTASGQSPQAQRTNIEFCFEQSTCPNVTALAISNVTSTSATATWEPMGSETSWNVYLSTTEVADMSSIVGTPVSAMSYPMSNLLVDQDYWFYVQPVCTGADSWRVATFRTVATCFPPMGLTTRDITSTTAVVCWQDTNAVGNYTVLYGEATTLDLNDPATYQTVQATDTMLQLNGLTPYTTYAFVVRCDCDDMSSRYSTAATFKTGAGIPFEPIFETTTLPTDWKRYDGLFNADTILTSALTTSSKWSLTTATDAINSVHFKANIYGTGTKGWVVTPKIDLTNVAEGTGMILRFDAALCKYGNPSTAPIAQDTDDKFAVIISRDGGLTWTKANMTLWQNIEGADYNYYEVPVTGKTYCIDMTQYAGLNIAIAFYGESTVSGADNDFHFGNISLNYGTYTVYTENACQGVIIDNHGFDEASTDSVGAFHFEAYTPATEMMLQQFVTMDLNVYETLNNEVIVDTAYVGDHYVDRFYDFYVQEGDEEAYGFEEVNIHGCDSVWLVTFYNILTAETILENHELAEGETYIWHEMSITEPGLYYDTVRSEMGGVKAYYELTVTAAAPVGEGRTFELVTAPQADWSGNYLIVFADNKAHATVSGKDLVATSDVLTISEDNKIVTADTCYVTVTAMGNDYSVLLPNGFYLGAQKNGVISSAAAVALTFSYTADGVQIAGLANGVEYILYCNTNNGTFYRMYTDKTGNSGYALPQLYKEVSGEGPGTKVETINAEDGAVKVILNGSLYIIRDNQWYDATGRLTVDPRK